MTASDEHLPGTEYKRGDHITYRRGKHTYTGTIAWVISPSQLLGQSPPTRYFVERDGDKSSIPDEVLPVAIMSKESAQPNMTTLDEQFETLYGPLAPFSDFKKGEHITYRSEGQTRTGTIVWIATATYIAGRDIPIQYIVECDQHSGFPDNVPQSDIIMDPQKHQTEEATMVKCPYCGGLHYAHLIEQCPNNPLRDKRC